MIKESEIILKQPTRKKIYKTINSQPGICIRELERTLRLALGELTYHIPLLLKCGLIVEEFDGYFRRFFPSTINVSDKKIISLLRKHAVVKVMPFLLSNKKFTNREMSNALSISPSTTNWHLNRFIANNLIKKFKSKDKIYYSLDNRKAINRIYLQ